MKTRILLIYTGGTIGMKQDPETLLLKPFNFNQILDEVPELKKFDCLIDNYSFTPAIDSSDVTVSFWVDLVRLIFDNYDKYDGFVVLHGTDTMAYSASALSFMLEDLEKPVIFTGSQLPIGMLRTDGKENLISSIELAGARAPDGQPFVPEVAIYFENQLYRGNRTTKYNAENFRAFRSANCPVLADVGIHVKYNGSAIRRPSSWGEPLKIHTDLDTNVAVLRIYPGITPSYVNAILSVEGLRAVILETYGSGNSFSDEWFTDALRNFDGRGGVIVNVTQCQAGCVDMTAYAAGAVLSQCGVISGYDITFEAALAKLYLLLARYSDSGEVKRHFEIDICGEFSNK